jgi:hypothetical protein
MACRLKTDEGHPFLMLTDGRVLDNRYDRSFGTLRENILNS